jgi:predicted outer membrane protein
MHPDGCTAYVDTKCRASADGCEWFEEHPLTKRLAAALDNAKAEAQRAIFYARRGTEAEQKLEAAKQAMSESRWILAEAWAADMIDEVIALLLRLRNRLRRRAP